MDSVLLRRRPRVGSSRPLHIPLLLLAVAPWTRLLVIVSLFSISFSVAQITSVGQAGRFILWKNTNGASWTFARDHCESDGGWLAVDVSVESHNVLVTIPGGGVGAWLGGSDAPIENVWRWVTGPVGREDKGRGRVFFTGTFNNNPTCILQHCFWNALEPNDYKHDQSRPWLGEHNLAVFSGTVAWNDAPNPEDFPQPVKPLNHWYCEYPGEPETAVAEMYPLQLFSRANSSGISWYEARQICTIYNSSLAIEIDMKSHMILDQLGASLPLGKTAFIGGTDFTVRGEWRWTSGVAQADDGNLGRLFYKKAGDECLQPSSIGCRWAAAEPVVGTEASFLALRKTASGVEWISLEYPATADYFICEFPPPTATPSLSVVPSLSSTGTPARTASPTHLHTPSESLSPSSYPATPPSSSASGTLAELLPQGSETKTTLPNPNSAASETKSGNSASFTQSETEKPLMESATHSAFSSTITTSPAMADAATTEVTTIPPPVASESTRMASSETSTPPGTTTTQPAATSTPAPQSSTTTTTSPSTNDGGGGHPQQRGNAPLLNDDNGGDSGGSYVVPILMAGGSALLLCCIIFAFLCVRRRRLTRELGEAPKLRDLFIPNRNNRRYVNSDADAEMLAVASARRQQQIDVLSLPSCVSDGGSLLTVPAYNPPTHHLYEDDDDDDAVSTAMTAAHNPLMEAPAS